MTPTNIAIVSLFCLLQVCIAIDYKKCIENVNDTIRQYKEEYDIYIQRKYTWIDEIAESYKAKILLLPGYDPDNPQLCDEFEYTFEVFKRCGGFMIDDSTYMPKFHCFSNDEDICKWLAAYGTEFYAKTSKNKQVKIDCDFDAGLDSYNDQHGLCFKEHIGTE